MNKAHLKQAKFLIESSLPHPSGAHAAEAPNPYRVLREGVVTLRVGDRDGVAL
jgi:hypothetical protein